MGTVSLPLSVVNIVQKTSFVPNLVLLLLDYNRDCSFETSIETCCMENYFLCRAFWRKKIEKMVDV